MKLKIVLVGAMLAIGSAGLVAQDEPQMTPRTPPKAETSAKAGRRLPLLARVARNSPPVTAFQLPTRTAMLVPPRPSRSLRAREFHSS